jgi:signal transduction histidine kinase
MRSFPAFRASLQSRGARYQFAIGVALLSLVPMLGLWIVVSRGDQLPAVALSPMQSVTIAGFSLLVGIAGYLTLRKYPENIARLRRYSEDIVRGILPERIVLIEAEDDICAIEQSMNMVVDKLRREVKSLATIQIELESQFQQAQKMESLGVIAGGVAHDFGNLLTSILSNVDEVILDLPNGSEALNCATDIKLAAQQASGVVSQMLTYAGKASMAVGAVDLSQLIKDMHSLLSSSINKRHKLKLSLCENLPAIMGDKIQINQVAMNLVLNASDAIDGDGCISIETGVSMLTETDLVKAVLHGDLVPGEYVYLRVHDTGCGMDEETKLKAFDPFFTTKATGTGLGLAAVLGIVKRHGGGVILETEPGQGTTFSILFKAAL